MKEEKEKKMRKNLIAIKWEKDDENKAVVCGSAEKKIDKLQAKEKCYYKTNDARK